MDEGHQVGILLDGARFPQVGELRALAAATGFDRTVQLRKCDDRYVELLGDRLERPGNHGHLLFTVAVAVVCGGRHQLQVVDNNQLDIILSLEPSYF